MRKTTLFSLLILCLLSQAVSAQTHPTRDWGTYYGNDFTNGYSIAADRFGNTYMLCTTTSGKPYEDFGTVIAPPSLATPGSYQPNITDYMDTGNYSSSVVPDDLLIKFNSAGERLWATYYGGPGAESGQVVTCDSAGNVYIAGTTTSSANIATTGQTVYAGNTDVFLVKFDGTGARQWATYFGGTQYDGVNALITDNNGNLYMAGYTASDSGIATPGSFQPGYINGGGNSADAVLAKFTAATGALQWATYYGSVDIFAQAALVCDAAGNIYAAGTTADNTGVDLATPGSQQPVEGGGEDAFIVKFTPNGQRIWGTYYGGSQDETEVSLAYDSTGNNIYLAGLTASSDNIATPGGFQNQGYLGSGGRDAFLVKFDTTGERQWGTYYDDGAAGGTFAGVQCDEYGNIYLMATTASNINIATPNSYQDSFAGQTDAYLIKFNSGGGRIWGTYYGSISNGSYGENTGTAIVACNDYVYMLGSSESATGIATAGSFQSNDSAYTDWAGVVGAVPFLVKFYDCSLGASITGGTVLCAGDSILLHANNSDYSIHFHWQKNAADIPGATDSVLMVNTAGIYSVIVSGDPACADTSMPDTVIAHPALVVNITSVGDTLHASSGFAGYQWNMNDQPISGATDSVYISSQGAGYSVMVTDTDGCSATSGITTGVANINADMTIHIYPNPASDQLYISAPVPVNVAVYTMEGQLLFSDNKTNAIQVAQLPAGTYFLRISDDAGNIVKIDHFVKLN